MKLTTLTNLAAAAFTLTGATLAHAQILSRPLLDATPTTTAAGCEAGYAKVEEFSDLLGLTHMELEWGQYTDAPGQETPVKTEYEQAYVLQDDGTCIWREQWVVTYQTPMYRSGWRKMYLAVNDGVVAAMYSLYNQVLKRARWNRRRQRRQRPSSS